MSQIASACDPLFRLLHTQGAYEAFTGLLVGEDLTAPVDLSIESFQNIDRTNAFGMRFWKVKAGLKSWYHTTVL